MWEVIVRREVRPVIDALKGKGAGFQKAYEQLVIDPCASSVGKDGQVKPFAYRLSGPLAEKVCGRHLDRGYRLAFSMRRPDNEHASDVDGIVEILYVGKRDTRDRNRDVWSIVHDLFGEESPPEDHLRPPCCEDDLPLIDVDELAVFTSRLRAVLRGRRPERHS